MNELSRLRILYGNLAEGIYTFKPFLILTSLFEVQSYNFESLQLEKKIALDGALSQQN